MDSLASRETSTPLIVTGIVISIVSLNGCGRAPDKWEAKRPKTHAVRGLVLWDGVAEPGVTVAFDSREHNLTAVGVTDTSGQFTLKTYEPGDGAVAGEHAIRLEKTVMVIEGAPDANLPPSYRVVTPKKYADTSTSGLTATVVAEGPNDITIAITGPRAELTP
jgi:hypothetical protein